MIVFQSSRNQRLAPPSNPRTRFTTCSTHSCGQMNVDRRRPSASIRSGQLPGGRLGMCDEQSLLGEKLTGHARERQLRGESGAARLHNHRPQMPARNQPGAFGPSTSDTRSSPDRVDKIRAQGSLTPRHRQRVQGRPPTSNFPQNRDFALRRISVDKPEWWSKWWSGP